MKGVKGDGTYRRARKGAAAAPQQRRFAIIGRLTDAAVRILNRKPDCELGDLAEELKQWAANNGVPYFDAWPGAATPIQQAITIATERRKTSMIRENEVDLREAVDMLDVPQEVLGKMAAEGKLKSRNADGTIYFLREEIEALIDRQIEEVRSKAADS
jgi:hypothetical protein